MAPGDLWSCLSDLLLSWFLVEAHRSPPPLFFSEQRTTNKRNSTKHSHTVRCLRLNATLSLVLSVTLKCVTDSCFQLLQPNLTQGDLMSEKQPWLPQRRVVRSGRKVGSCLSHGNRLPFFLCGNSISKLRVMKHEYSLKLFFLFLGETGLDAGITLLPSQATYTS